MKLIIYPKLGTRSKKAMTRQYWRFGNLYDYRPRGDLLDRLSRELNLTKPQVLSQIQDERRFLLRLLGQISG